MSKIGSGLECRFVPRLVSGCFWCPGVGVPVVAQAYRGPGRQQSEQRLSPAGDACRHCFHGRGRRLGAEGGVCGRF